MKDPERRKENKKKSRGNSNAIAIYFSRFAGVRARSLRPLSPIVLFFPQQQLLIALLFRDLYVGERKIENTLFTAIDLG